MGHSSDYVRDRSCVFCDRSTFAEISGLKWKNDIDHIAFKLMR
jgi:hypothetical protein